jgi:hypothetical protein
MQRNFESCYSSEQLGGIKRSRSAMRDNFGKFLPCYGFFRPTDIVGRFYFAVLGNFQPVLF